MRVSMKSVAGKAVEHARTVTSVGVQHAKNRGLGSPHYLRPFPRRHLPMKDTPSQKLSPIDIQNLFLHANDALTETTFPFLDSSIPAILPQTLLVEGHNWKPKTPLNLSWTDNESPHFSVQLNEPPAPPGRKEKHSDYYANVGDAIRTLREDIPQMFIKDLDYTIYRDDIVFRDPNLHFKGIKNYKIIFWSLRFHAKLFFTRMNVEVLRIWQPEDHQIKMRWRVVGKPRVWWETEGVIDGISTYKLDNEGMIYEHYVDNLQLRDPPITNPLLYGLNIRFQPQLSPQQVPYPGSWFRSSCSSSGVDGLIEMNGEQLTSIVDGGSY